MEYAPRGLLEMIRALDFYLYSPVEIAIVGKRESSATDALLAVCREQALPNRLIAMGEPSSLNKTRVALLRGKKHDSGRSAAYVCRDYACGKAVTDAAALREQLAAGPVAESDEKKRN